MSDLFTSRQLHINSNQFFCTVVVLEERHGRYPSVYCR